ncbi:MAG: ATP-dependent Clp protease adaptor ClpS [Thermonemataceae bacterium]
MSTYPDHDSEVLEDVETVITDQEERELVVFNDDYNTFDHVIDTLIKICGHEPQQAEQCTWIIHYKGKCAVKHGSFEYLKPMREGICDRGISAEII